MNIAAIALEEKNLVAELPAPLRTSSLRPNFSRSIGAADLGLEAASTKPLNYEVKRGDNLWTICRNCLRDQGKNPSKSELYRAVQDVAKANGLQNPDFIRIGQALDLSATRGSVTPPAPTQVIAQAMPAPQAVAKAMPPAAVITGPNPLPTSSVKTMSAQVIPPASGRVATSGGRESSNVRVWWTGTAGAGGHPAVGAVGQC